MYSKRKQNESDDTASSSDDNKSKLRRRNIKANYKETKVSECDLSRDGETSSSKLSVKMFKESSATEDNPWSSTGEDSENLVSEDDS